MPSNCLFFHGCFQSHFQFEDSIEQYAPKVVSQLQPRRTRCPLLVAKFKHKVSVQCSADDDPPKTITFEAPHPWQGVPVGSKLVDLQPVVSENGESGRLKATFGVFFGEEEFIEKVSTLNHPFDVPLPLDESNIAAMNFILSRSPAEVARYRSNRLKHYIDRAKALDLDEKKVHSSMRPDLRPAKKSKRLLLFKEMLSDAGVCDEELCKDVTEGFKLVGDLNPSGQLHSQWKPAMLSSDQLAQTAKWAQRAVVSSCKSV